MNNQAMTIHVGISDGKIVQAPDLIRTSGLGSCIGLVIYDRPQPIAGLAHMMLPHSSLSRRKNERPFKFVDTAIPTLIEMLLAAGATRLSLVAKITGGAQMFQFNHESPVMRIGERNIEATYNLLGEEEILATDVGGHHGRTIEFNPQTKALKIRTVYQHIRII